MELATIPLEAIDPPAESIRQHIPEDLLDELAESMRAVGMIEPMVVEKTGERYRIIAGHRRFLAARRVPLVHVQVVVRDDAAIATQAVQVHENIIRLDMTPAEEARLFQKIYVEEGEDIEKVAARVRLGVGYVDKRLALLAGDPLVLEALDKGEISIGVAEALNSVKHQAMRRERLDAAVRGGATVALARRWAAELNGLAAIQLPENQQSPVAPADPGYQPVANSLSCWFCEGNHDLHLLRMVQMHESCIKAADALLRKIGREA